MRPGLYDKLHEAIRDFERGCNTRPDKIVCGFRTWRALDCILVFNGIRVFVSPYVLEGSIYMLSNKLMNDVIKDEWGRVVKYKEVK